MRNTPLSSAVLELLASHAKPLSVPTLLDLLADKDLTPNKTTLYRMLEKLVQENQVESVLLSEKATYYELKTDHHHHHFVCNSCDKIECVEDPALEQQINRAEAALEAQGLKIEKHQFSLSGTCPTCQ